MTTIGTRSPDQRFPGGFTACYDGGFGTAAVARVAEDALHAQHVDDEPDTEQREREADHERCGVPVAEPESDLPRGEAEAEQDRGGDQQPVERQQ
jgi:hypothetical protein